MAGNVPVGIDVDGRLPSEARAALARDVSDPESEIGDALSGTFVPQVDLVSGLVAPIYISHRGGPRRFPEHSMEGYRASAEAGFLPEFDIQALSDGTLVCVHDTTTDRTMNVSDTVADMTRAEWLAARIRPALDLRDTSSKGRGWAVPVLWEDVLNELGGRIVLVPEIKASEPTVATAVIASIVERGLQRAVIVQSFDYPACLESAAAGIATMFLNDVATPATLASDGIEFVGASTGAAAAYLASMDAAGVRPIVWTPNSRTAANTAFSNGAHGIFTDDAWGLSGRFAVAQDDDLASLALPPMANPYPHANQHVEMGRTSFKSIHDGGASASTAAIRWGQFGEGTTEVTIRGRARFLPGAVSTSQWFAVWVGKHNTLSDEPFLDTGDVNGYHFLFRRNGIIRTYKRIGTTTTALGSDQNASITAATTDTSEWFEFEIVIDAANVTQTTDWGSGATSTVADTSARDSDAFISMMANGCSYELDWLEVERN